MTTAHHPMHYAGLRSGYHEFLCDACGRHLLIHANPTAANKGDQTFVVLKQGDFRAAHSGSVGGLVIDGVEVADEDELNDEWKEWLDEILGDDN